jgi:hypothetical protein
MRNVALVLIGVSALAFLLAVIASYVGPFAGVSAEGFSRACTNLAAIAIALHICFKK